MHVRTDLPVAMFHRPAFVAYWPKYAPWVRAKFLDRVWSSTSTIVMMAAVDELFTVATSKVQR